MPDRPTNLTKEHYDAVLFDLDGVLTDTASVHAACWKQLFDDLLRHRAEGASEPFVEFDIDADYHAYVDGKPCRNGVRDFLASRNITLPEGTPDDPPGQQTVQALGNRKDLLFGEALERQGVKVFHGSVRLIRRLRSEGVLTAVVSASKHCQQVLQVAGIEDLFDTRVDGTTLEELGMAGKPAPDSYLEAARRLEVQPARAVVVEDAISGVRSGTAGGFGLVIGVARKNNAEELRRQGADITVTDLEELTA